MDAVGRLRCFNLIINRGFVVQISITVIPRKKKKNVFRESVL